MNFLIIGDVIGKPGRHAVHNCMARVKTDYSIDFVVANGENLAGGSGIQPDTFRQILETGSPGNIGKGFPSIASA